MGNYYSTNVLANTYKHIQIKYEVIYFEWIIHSWMSGWRAKSATRGTGSIHRTYTFFFWNSIGHRGLGSWHFVLLPQAVPRKFLFVHEFTHWHDGRMKLWTSDVWIIPAVGIIPCFWGTRLDYDYRIRYVRTFLMKRGNKENRKRVEMRLEIA